MLCKLITVGYTKYVGGHGTICSCYSYLPKHYNKMKMAREMSKECKRREHANKV